MSDYPFFDIERKWKQRWDEERVFSVDANGERKKEKRYVLDMFPYPSGQGLHVGHPEGYTATDIVSRYYRHKGYDVLHPMGWDSFGLPAENYAIKTGKSPQETTTQNIATFKRQIQALGFSYDWDRELNTSSPDYYRWTQWLFLQLYKKGLAYKQEAPVNWCDSCKTVLANEQVVGGKCERCGSSVVQKNLSQWFFKITAYAQELLDSIDEMDWSESLKTTQKNWIGRSDGARIQFSLASSQDVVDTTALDVFTTRPDTIFGATFLVLAPEHQIIDQMKEVITNWEDVDVYRGVARAKTELERKESEKEKTGVMVEGVVAINPANGNRVPVFIADYVLSGYGTGAIMGVPAHDKRDYDFAKRYDIPIVRVVDSSLLVNDESIYDGEGKLINSGEYNGMSSLEAGKAIVEKLGGEFQVRYKLRDWLISRQRYWGSPIPIVYCDQCGEVPVPENQLPVMLPNDVDFLPTGESPLMRSTSFHSVSCPVCGGAARRESDTMDTFVCSSWYFLRFADPHNIDAPFDTDTLHQWMPVDLYVGGMEHAVGHLLYARFITKALRDMGHLSFDEPFLTIRNQGLILGENGEKMSKSRGNVVNPDDIIRAVGADTLRMYEMFMGPLEESKPWNTNGTLGVLRFLNRVWKMLDRLSDYDDTEAIHAVHKAIAKVTDDIEGLRFNTAVSALMICLNTLERHAISAALFERFVLLLSPFAPFIAEELWERLGHTQSIAYEQWPVFDPILVEESMVDIGVQFSGKTRGSVRVQKGADQSMVMAVVMDDARLSGYIPSSITRVIFVPDKIINIIE